jgi:hypothetical protein
MFDQNITARVEIHVFSNPVEKTLIEKGAVSEREKEMKRGRIVFLLI